MDGGGEAASTSAVRRMLGEAGEKNGKSALPRRPAQPPRRCPECGSTRIWRDGLRYTRHGEVQRWLCRSCGFRFSESTLQRQVKVNVAGKAFKGPNPQTNHPDVLTRRGDPSLKKSLGYFSFAGCEDVGSHDRSQSTVVEKELNKPFPYNRERRVCDERDGSRKDPGSPREMKHIGSGRAGAVQTKAAKNLAEVESRKQERAAGATETQPTEADVKGKLIEFLWWMKKEGYAESTIKTRVRNLRRLVKLGANIYDPESVKEVIANQSTCANTKANIVDAYNTFLQMLGLEWKAPRYRQERAFPFIPTEAEIDALIASCGRKTATFLQLLKETGMRSGEAFRLEWRNIDVERRLINLTLPEKGSNPRIFQVSSKLIDMLSQLPRKSERVFGKATLCSLRVTFCASRKRAAKKLANPRLLQIHFHTFRHWKAVMEYHKTKDPYHVKQLLGHKSLRNTEVYINLEQAIFTERDDSEYITRIAKTVKGARALLEAGFEYVTDMDGFKLFRKRK